MSDWAFFSNYGHVLIFLAENPKARLRDVSAAIGITERAVQKIVHDLQASDFLTIKKQGRRNQYKINRRKHLRHRVVSGATVGQLINTINFPPDKPIKTLKEKKISGREKHISEETEAERILREKQGSLGF
jgi:Mn-dependent DtxR family transcriptional regulator